MPIWYAVVMGIVQGLTEFLPVSSSGHLVLLSVILKENEGPVFFFTLMLHLGTFAAVVYSYRRDVAAIAVGVVRILPDFAARRRPSDPDARRVMWLLLISLVPLFFVLPFMDTIEEAFNSPLIVGIALMATAGILWLADSFLNGVKDMRGMTAFDAFSVGLSQMLAVIPGLSRSGTTISMGLLRGLDRETAVKFSFLMSLPTVAGAILIESRGAFEEGLSGGTLAACLIGAAAAFAVGCLAISAVRYISREGKFRYFAAYCFAVGVAAVMWALL